ncbi:RNA-dependent RNA polymerase family protein [Roseococcus thiosulfatophilus]|uniref:hypothetical protein n=1 Tax=Roseococcus thiosulfatophilus TaxID=35813 RepID=UPI001A8D9210|nr:hypothetical protein [Roseococcus thiosulfatophilus]
MLMLPYKGKRIKFVRWVDDYVIFCKSESEAQIILYELGARLFDFHGLTLSGVKTKILTTEEFLTRRSFDDENSVERAVNQIRTIFDDLDFYDEDNQEIDSNSIDQTDLNSLDNILASLLSSETALDYDSISMVIKYASQINLVDLEMQ